MKSAIKIMSKLHIIPAARYGRQATFATNRTQQRLRPQLKPAVERPTGEVMATAGTSNESMEMAEE